MSVKAMDWTFQQDLEPTTKLVLLALADHADDDGVCWPGMRLVAQKAGISKRTAQRHVKKLEDAGLLRKETRMEDEGQTSNKYILAVVGDQSPAPGDRMSSPRESSSCHGPHDTVVSSKSSLNHQQEEPRAIQEADDCVSTEIQELAMEVYRHVPPCLAQWNDQYPPPWIPMAIERTRARNKTSPAYTKAILEDWRQQGGPDEKDNTKNRKGTATCPEELPPHQRM